jgi:hypothetical protein
MKKIIFIIIVLGLTSVFAKGGGSAGGGSFGSEKISDKYGSLKLSKEMTGISDDLVIQTFIHVRYKQLFNSYDWKSGYATSTVYKNGKKFIVDNLKINQHMIYHDGGGASVTNGVKKSASMNNISSLRLNLNENWVVVATKHYITVNNKTFSKGAVNQWGGSISSYSYDKFVTLEF